MRHWLSMSPINLAQNHRTSCLFNEGLIQKNLCHLKWMTLQYFCPWTIAGNISLLTYHDRIWHPDLFLQHLINADIEVNITAPHYALFARSPVHYRQRRPIMRKVFSVSWRHESSWMRFTKSTFSVSFFISQLFNAIKTLIIWMIPCSYIAGVVAAELPTNMSVIKCI